MTLELFPRYIQVSIDEESIFLKKALNFVSKHFKNTHKYACSVMIFDNPKERYKKEYFLNWLYHLSIFKESESSRNLFKSILQNIHLPIRIKITNKRKLIEHVKVEMKLITQDRILLRLDRPNRLARRYLISAFRDHIVGQRGFEIFLRSDSKLFWEKILSGITQKTIFNVSIEFLYDKWDIYKNNANIKSYMTTEEKRLRKSLAILNCNIDENYESIKNKYLMLVKQYHPDNVFGLEKAIVDSYIEKFRAIQEAFEIIKNSYCKAA